MLATAGAGVAILNFRRAFAQICSHKTEATVDLHSCGVAILQNASKLWVRVFLMIWIFARHLVAIISILELNQKLQDVFCIISKKFMHECIR